METTQESSISETQQSVTTEDTAGAKFQGRKPGRRRVTRGQAHIKCSYNNTMVAITDLNGAMLGWASSGSLGFRGAKKATPYAATVVVAKVVENVSRTGLKEVDVLIKGVGGGREAAVRALGNNGLKVNSIKDITPVPHNGCRPKKPRRV